MYRHGLGDCFLLQFPTDAGGTFYILIDCGLISVAKDPKTMMARVTADIAATCRGRLDLVIMTHEHWDHVSGFSTQQAQDICDQIQIREVWYAWTEDPDNALGCRLRQERESKLRALHRAVAGLRMLNTPLAVRRAAQVGSLLNFFGGEDPTWLGARGNATTPGKSRLAFDYLGKRPGVKRRYCYPKDAPVGLADVSGVRVYALGPPENEGLIKRSTPTKRGAEVYEFSSDLAFEESLAAAFERQMPGVDGSDKDCPFDLSYARKEVLDGSQSAPLTKILSELWNAPDAGWRKIDDDWTAAAEALALNLDKHTNNTCLVVAFELGASGRVLLFAADAQVGNWLSWQDTRWQIPGTPGPENVSGPDLLKRTVFYKVGHHGSHNATLRALGLEQMTSDELVAFLPVFKAQAMTSGWAEMPFDPLVSRLKEKTSGRLVLSDASAPLPGPADLVLLSDAQRAEFFSRLTVDPGGLYYEVAIDV